jgi:glucan-binding YG repeat protein
MFSESTKAAILKSSSNINDAVLRKAEEEKKAADIANSIANSEKQEKALQVIAQKQELERQKQKAIEAAQAALEAFKNKQFVTHQEARKFHNARKPGNPSGWLCNFTNTVHPEGPNGCDEPCHGGYWYTGDTIEVQRKGPS